MPKMKLIAFALLFLFVAVVALKPSLTQAETASAPRKALADVNRDGVISKLDLQAITNVYGTTRPIGVATLADVNQDGKVDILDASFVGSKVGKKVSVCELADFNNNKKVGNADLKIIKQYYGQTDNSTNMMADLNGDGKIDVSDLSIAGGVFKCTW